MDFRERIVQHGEFTLKDEELLAVLIRVGYQKMNALELAKVLLGKANKNLSELARMSIQELCQVKGIGPVKAIELKAALELGLRRCHQGINRKKISSSQQAYGHCRTLIREEEVEYFGALYLDRSNGIVHRKVLSKGGVSGTVVDVKVLLKEAISHLASGIIVFHNHPSGSLTPSQQDHKITQRISSGAKAVDICLLDHLILCPPHYYSFADEGEL